MAKRSATESQSTAEQPPRKKKRVSPVKPIKTVKRLGLGKSRLAGHQETRPVNLRGSRPSKQQGSGGFAATPSEEVQETLWVTRKTSFVAYLKRATSAVINRGAAQVTFRALGAAIPLALRLAAAVRDALPGDDWTVHVKTGSETVTDELEPVEEDEDYIYRDRVKSTVEAIVLRVPIQRRERISSYIRPEGDHGRATVAEAEPMEHWMSLVASTSRVGATNALPCTCGAQSRARKISKSVERKDQLGRTVQDVPARGDMPLVRRPSPESTRLGKENVRPYYGPLKRFATAQKYAPFQAPSATLLAQTPRPRKIVPPANGPAPLSQANGSLPLSHPLTMSANHSHIGTKVLPRQIPPQVQLGRVPPQGTPQRAVVDSRDRAQFLTGLRILGRSATPPPESKRPIPRAFDNFQALGEKYTSERSRMPLSVKNFVPWASKELKMTAPYGGRDSAGADRALTSAHLANLQDSARQRGTNPTSQPAQPILGRINRTSAPAADSSGPARREDKLDRYIKPKVLEVAKAVEIPSTISIDDLATSVAQSPAKVREILKSLGLSGPLTERRDLTGDEAALVTLDLGFKPVFDKDAFDIQPDSPHAEPSLQPIRPPVVCIMGHVDHGKTTLLDTLRSASVAQGEAGGITQHIGAFEVPLKALFKGAGRDKAAIASAGDQTITFLDTPGHAAFSAMRARGAGVTDISVLVVAADDGVKPQTREVIDLVSGTDVALVVAITKCDKDGADPTRAIQELSDAGINVESVGGEVPCVQVSALNKQGLDELLENLTAIAEVRELRAERTGVRCEARVIEANRQVGRGNVATVVITRGTLEAGKWVLAGTSIARARALIAPSGATLRQASPGQPVEIAGWKTLPSAGDRVLEAYSEDEAIRALRTREMRMQRLRDLEQVEGINARAKELASMINREKRNVANSDSDSRDNKGAAKLHVRNQLLQKLNVITSENGGLDDDEIRLIVRSDYDGTLEAIASALEALRKGQYGTRIISQGLGEISDQDVELAAASKAVIVGFNVKPSRSAAVMLKQHKNIEMLSDKVIYALIEAVKDKVVAILPDLVTTSGHGTAEVLQRFLIPTSKDGKKVYQSVAGCKIKSGTIEAGYRVKVLRGARAVFEGPIESLRIGKNDVTSVPQGQECGVAVNGFEDFRGGDVLQFFMLETTKQYL